MCLPMRKHMKLSWTGIDMGRTEKEPRIRKFLSFNPQVESHRQAYEIFEKHGFSSDFVIECIIRYEKALTREDLHQEIDKLLHILSIPGNVQVPEQSAYLPEERKTESDVKKIPQAMFDLMKQI